MIKKLEREREREKGNIFKERKRERDTFPGAFLIRNSLSLNEIVNKLIQNSINVKLLRNIKMLRERERER